MKTDTKRRIYDLCIREGGVRPHDLVKILGITNAAIHRHLRVLESEGNIEKRGTSPRVIYVASRRRLRSKGVAFSDEIEAIINKYFCYFSPDGRELLGVEAFLSFLERTNQDKNPKNRANEYVEIIKSAQVFQNKEGVICATKKIESTFNKKYLREVFYSDFYSLPKYGKTKLGQYILHGKSGQDRLLIKAVAGMVKKHIRMLIRKYKIEAVCFIPHSIPRKIPFLKEFKASLSINVPEIQFIKMFSGRVPIAQKSLSKLSERIENARETIFLMDQDVAYKKILLIDDALGSGATLNEVAKKLTVKGCDVWGYAIVGSYKGFEVIKEV